MHLPWRYVAPGDGPAISTSVTGAEAARLQSLAAGRQVLEIGSAFGYSAVTMALAGGQVTAADPHAQIGGSYEAMLANLAAYDVTSRVEIIREPSQSALPWLASEDARFGLVFIDGDHQGPVVRHDIEWGLKLLEPGGVLAVHDVGEACCCPDVGHVAGAMFGDEGETVDTMLLVTR